MKPIIIVGKGPTAREIKKSDKYDIATLNNTIWLAPEPTYSFFNDVELFMLMEDKDFESVTKIVCPTFLHSMWAKLEGKCEGDVTHWLDLYKLFPNRLDHIEFFLYELHAGDNTKPEEQERTGQFDAGVPGLPEWPLSTGQTATMWLLKYAGYRDFIVAGFDVEGGYHPIFIGAGHEDGVKGFNGQGTAAQPQGYHAYYAQSVKWADYYQARFRHINELSEEELNDLGI